MTGGRLSVVRRIRPAMKLKINDLPIPTRAWNHTTALLQIRHLATGRFKDKAQPRHTSSDSVLPRVLALWPHRSDPTTLNFKPARRYSIAQSVRRFVPRECPQHSL